MADNGSFDIREGMLVLSERGERLGRVVRCERDRVLVGRPPWFTARFSFTPEEVQRAGDGEVVVGRSLRPLGQNTGAPLREPSLADDIRPGMPVVSADRRLLGRVLTADRFGVTIERGAAFRVDVMLPVRDVTSLADGIVLMAGTREEIERKEREKQQAPKASRQVEDRPPSVTIPPAGERIDTHVPFGGDRVNPDVDGPAGTRVNPEKALSFIAVETVIPDAADEFLDLREATIVHRQLARIEGPLPMDPLA